MSSGIIPLILRVHCEKSVQVRAGYMEGDLGLPNEIHMRVF